VAQSGQRETEKLKNVKTERFATEPLDRTHDWVLAPFARRATEGMLRSYKFESRRILMQDVEVSANKVPFQIVQPRATRISLHAATPYTVKAHARDARHALHCCICGPVRSPMNCRVIGVVGTGKRQIQISANMASIIRRCSICGSFWHERQRKVYSADRTLQLTQ